MSDQDLLLQNQSCRVAMAAYLHDLGKLAQRAKAFDADSRRDAHLTQYCPFRQDGGYFSHQHAADTALAFDVLEPHLPALLGGDPSPFMPRGSDAVTDSLINAAAMHHKPDTFLQWIVATADRVASGFERTEFDQYNSKKDRDDFRSARLLVRFEEYGGPGKAPRFSKEEQFGWRYPIAPLSPNALMPVKRDAQRTDAGGYSALWQMLLGEGDGPAGIGRIPKSHRTQWPLWLDHFDTLWQTVAHAIPSAAAFGTRPDVSLYDHSRTTAAIAVALWRWHQGGDAEAARQSMAGRTDWGEEKFLLVQGDFSGVQSFIFGGEGSTQKKAAKLLRGRSALVSLLCELAALAVLDALALPPTSQVLNAAGKFLILAPNTPECRVAVANVQERLNDWFLQHCFGISGISLATIPASCNDFVGKERFKAVQARLWKSLEHAKRQMFGMTSPLAPDPVRTADFSLLGLVDKGYPQFD